LQPPKKPVHPGSFRNLSNARLRLVGVDHDFAIDAARLWVYLIDTEFAWLKVIRDASYVRHPNFDAQENFTVRVICAKIITLGNDLFDLQLLSSLMLSGKP